MFPELTFEEAVGGWSIAKVKVCLVFKPEVDIDMETVLHNYTKNYTYEAVGQCHLFAKSRTLIVQWLNNISQGMKLFLKVKIANSSRTTRFCDDYKERGK